MPASRHTKKPARPRNSLQPGLAIIAICLLATVLFAAPPPSASTAQAVPLAPAQTVFTVNTTADPGDGICDADACTLRSAILAANAADESATIEFNLPGDGPHTIAVQSALPPLTNQITIDGTSQTGYAGTPLIELSGSNSSVAYGLNLDTGADFSTVRGLAINQFGGGGLSFSGNGGIIVRDTFGVTLEQNYIGVAPDGTSPRGNTFSGIHLGGATSATVRGNIVVATQGTGILITGAATQNNVFESNFIGTNANGDDLGNRDDGVRATNSGPQIIGGTYLAETSACCVGNYIAFNGGNGVTITAGGNASYEKGILGNRVYANGGLGIDLQNDGVTPNDPDDSDGDGMANRLQNYPVLTTATVDSGITITGTLTTRPSQFYRLEFFANDVCDDSGHGQGQRYLGGIRQESNDAGQIVFSLPFTTTVDPVNVGDFISATATDLEGNTSEFSACIEATSSASPSPAAQTFLPTLQAGLQEE